MRIKENIKMRQSKDLYIGQFQSGDVDIQIAPVPENVRVKSLRFNVTKRKNVKKRKSLAYECVLCSTGK